MFVSIHQPPLNRVFPIYLDRMAEPTDKEVAACLSGREEPAGGAGATRKVLSKKDNVPVPAPSSTGPPAAVAVVKRVYADWECSTGHMPPANVPCRRVPMDESLCPYDKNAGNASKNRQYVLEFVQPAGAPHANTGTVNLYCIASNLSSDAAKVMLNGSSGKKGVHMGVYAPAEPPVPACRSNMLPLDALDAHCSESPSSPLCALPARLEAQCAAAFQEWSARAAMNTNVQTGRAGLNSVASPTLRNHVSVFTPQSIHAKLKRVCQDFPRSVRTKLMHEVNETGLQDTLGSTLSLEPQVWKEYEHPHGQETIPVTATRSTGESILQNLNCLSLSPHKNILSCTAYAKESDPPQSVAVYLENDLVCSPPVVPQSSDENTQRLDKNEKKLQEAYRQCMSTTMCNTSSATCGSPTNPYSTTDCLRHTGETACTEDSLCAWDAAAQKCESLCLGRDTSTCVDPCGSFQDPGACNAAPHHCYWSNGACASQCSQSRFVNRPVECNNFTLDCSDKTNGPDCRSHGEQGSCIWNSRYNQCVPSSDKQVCKAQAQGTQCLPANTPCQLDHRNNTDLCVPACTQSETYGQSVASALAQECTASNLLTMNDVVAYQVLQGGELTPDALIGAWQHDALVDKPWSTMQLGTDSLTHALHAAQLLDSDTYGMSFEQTFGQGGASYTPNSIQSGGAGADACNVYMLEETCSKLAYTCVKEEDLPMDETGDGVNVGGMQSGQDKTVRYYAAANLRTGLETRYALQEEGEYSTTPSLAEILNAPTWGCHHLKSCETCQEKGNVQSCGRNGYCCRRTGCPP